MAEEFDSASHCPCKFWINGKPAIGTPELGGRGMRLPVMRDGENGWEEIFVKMVVPWNLKQPPLLILNAKLNKDEFGRPMSGELPQVTIDQPTESGFRPPAGMGRTRRGSR